METNASIQRSPSLAPQDDKDPQKMDSKLVTENTARANGSSLRIPAEGPRSEPTSAPLTVIQNDVINNERDPTFSPRRPSLSNIRPCNSGVTLVFEAGDDTEAEANPISLRRHHSERQSMATQRATVEASDATAQISGELKDFTPSADDQIPEAPLGGTKEQDRSNVQAEPCEEADQETFPNPAHPDNGLPQGDSIKPLEASKGNGVTLIQHCNIAKEFDTYTENMTARALGVPEAARLKETPQNVDYFDSDSKDSLGESEKGSGEVQILKKAFAKMHFTPTDEKQNESGKAKRREEFWRIASDILQGERLLQRLQRVQERQEADINARQEMSHEREREEKFLTGDLGASGRDRSGEDVREDIVFQTVNSDGTKTSLSEDEKTQGNGSGEAREKMPAQCEHHETATGEGEGEKGERSTDPPSVRCEFADWLPIDSNEAIPGSTTLRSSCHRLSVTETSAERRLHEDVRGEQTLQRAAGILNLADDPDVLEIPFQTDIALEPLPTKMCAGGEPQLNVSQPEIRRESPRPPATTAQGGVSKEYRGREAHQLKKTKLPFEAFQQETPQGPTRLRKALATAMTDQASPSVLERTQSLDMLSTSEAKKGSEKPHPKIPSGGSRERTRLSPYAKQAKNGCLWRSSDSINSDVTAQVVEIDGSPGRRKLNQNPFFNLRPALALKPEVEEDIREAEAREDELRRQRSTLYGEKQQRTGEGGQPPCASTVVPGEFVARGSQTRFHGKPLLESWFP